MTTSLMLVFSLFLFYLGLSDALNPFTIVLPDGSDYVSYTGEWDSGPYPAGPECGVWTNTRNSTITFIFQGNYLDVYGDIPGHPTSINATLDNKPLLLLGNSVGQCNEHMWHWEDTPSPPDLHTFRAVFIGTPDSPLVIQRFIVWGSSTSPATPSTPGATDGQIVSSPTPVALDALSEIPNATEPLTMPSTPQTSTPVAVPSPLPSRTQNTTVARANNSSGFDEPPVMSPSEYQVNSKTPQGIFDIFGHENKLTFSGTGWKTDNWMDQPACGIWTNVVGDYVTYEFRGSSLTVIGDLNALRGLYSATLDEQDLPLQDITGESPYCNETIYNWTGVGGDHTFKAIYTDTSQREFLAVEKLIWTPVQTSTTSSWTSVSTPTPIQTDTVQPIPTSAAVSEPINTATATAPQTSSTEASQYSTPDPITTLQLPTPHSYPSPSPKLLSSANTPPTVVLPTALAVPSSGTAPQSADPTPVTNPTAFSSMSPTSAADNGFSVTSRPLPASTHPSPSPSSAQQEPHQNFQPSSMEYHIPSYQVSSDMSSHSTKANSNGPSHASISSPASGVTASIQGSVSSRLLSSSPSSTRLIDGIPSRSSPPLTETKLHTVNIGPSGRTSSPSESSSSLVTVPTSSQANSTSPGQSPLSGGENSQHKIRAAVIAGSTVGALAIIAALIVTTHVAINSTVLGYVVGSILFALGAAGFGYNARRLIIKRGKNLADTKIALIITCGTAEVGFTRELIVWHVDRLDAIHNQFSVDFSCRDCDGLTRRFFGTFMDAANHAKLHTWHEAPAVLEDHETGRWRPEDSNGRSRRLTARNKTVVPRSLVLGTGTGKAVVGEVAEKDPDGIAPFAMIPEEQFQPGNTYESTGKLYLHAFRVDMECRAGVFGNHVSRIEQVKNDLLTRKGPMEIDKLAPLTTWIITSAKDGALKLEIGINEKEDVKQFNNECKIQKGVVMPAETGGVYNRVNA